MPYRNQSLYKHPPQHYCIYNCCRLLLSQYLHYWLGLQGITGINNEGITIMASNWSSLGINLWRHLSIYFIILLLLKAIDESDPSIDTKWYIPSFIPNFGNLLVKPSFFFLKRPQKDTCYLFAKFMRDGITNRASKRTEITNLACISLMNKIISCWNIYNLHTHKTWT